MRIEQIRREAKKLKKKINSQPRIWQFHGRRVVHASEWKWGDWTKLPDRYSILIVYGKSVPEDYLRDYAALLEKLEDPTYGKSVCWSCVIHQAQDAKKELDRHDRYWQEHGGEDARERWYEEAGEPYTSSFRKQDAMRRVEWRIYNELAEANNRTCEVLNYFHCPYGDAWRQLLEDGNDAQRLWQHIYWYDNHWNRSTSYTPGASDMKWYHYDEPAIIDVTNYDDIMEAIEDGRLDKIVQEHERYMKETNREIWALQENHALVSIHRYVSDKRGREEATIRYLSLKESGFMIADLTAEIAREAGFLKSLHPNIPTGDCTVASTALATKAKILSDDKHYDEIKGISRTWLQAATPYPNLKWCDYNQLEASSAGVSNAVLIES